MFQNVNKHRRAHLERSFGEHAIASLTRTPKRTHCLTPWRSPLRTLDRPLVEPWWILDEPQLLWIVSSNGLSKWAHQCLFTFWNITILDCNSNYLVLYSIHFFDTNVYNEYWLTFYYQWLEPGNGSSSCCHWLYPASITILDCNSN